VRDFALDAAPLPWPVAVAKGSYDVVEKPTQQRFSFRDACVSALDSSFLASGVVKDYLGKGLKKKADITLQGDSGPEAVRWVSDLVHLPPDVRIRPPLSVQEARVVWEEGGKAAFRGDLVVHRGPRVSLDLLQTPEELSIKKLLVQHGDSSASLQFTLKERNLRFAFAGELPEKTMRELYEGHQYLPGMLEGDFRARMSLDHTVRSTAQGRLAGREVILPRELKIPIRVESFSLNAEENHLRLESGRFTLGDSPMALAGDVNLSHAGWLFDMDLSTDLLDWNSIEEITGSDAEEGDHKSFKKLEELPIHGTLRLASNRFRYEGFSWIPLHADISLSPSEIHVAVTEADVCGISTPGVLKITPEEMTLDFRSVSSQGDLDAALECLWGKRGLMTGSFDTSGKYTGRGKGENLTESLRGGIEFRARQGRIYHNRDFGMFVKILERLSVADLFKGKIPDMKAEGFPYQSVQVKAKLEGRKLIFEEAVIVGEGMQIAWLGEVDLAKRELQLEVLAAPFRTVDSVAKRVPILGKILGGTLVSVPFKVEGDWTDPNVKAIPVSLVGSEVLEIMKRTVMLPVEVVQPLVTNE
jgi:hypothetical protein